MSDRTYRIAAARLREAYNLLGPFAGPCLICGNCPDRRHRVADAIAGALSAGEDPALVAEDYRGDASARNVYACLAVALAVREADPRLHKVTRARAAELDREVWADLTEARTT